MFVCMCVVTNFEADRESGGDLDICDPCQMPPPGLLEFHVGKRCLSAVPTFCADVCFLINVFHFFLDL